MSEPSEGEIVSWNRTFGFIRSSSDAPDLFFHISHTVPGERIACGKRVVFDTEPDKRRPDKMCAINVRLQERR